MLVTNLGTNTLLRVLIRINYNLKWGGAQDHFLEVLDNILNSNIIRLQFLVFQQNLCLNKFILYQILANNLKNDYQNLY